MAFILIIGIILVLYGGIHFYIGRWFWKCLERSLPFVSGKLFTAVFIIIAVGSVIGMVWSPYLPYVLQNGFYLAGSYWLAAVLYLTLLIALMDLLGLVGRGLRLIPVYMKHSRVAPVVAASFVFVAVAGLLTYGTFNAKNIQVTSYNINIPRQNSSLDELHIALVTDTHLGRLEDSGLNRIIDTVNAMNPDLVLIAGDIIDANRDTRPDELSEMEYNFRRIESRYGVYAVLGNHDYDHSGDSADRIQRFIQAGVQVLRDSSVIIADSFYLVGRDDLFYERISGIERMELSDIMGSFGENLPVILMDHQPVNLDEPRQAGVDLQVSGHTHKGQMFPINLITSLIYEIDYGHLTTEDFQIIVSSGARTWGPPVRIGTRSEVVSINILFD